MKAIALPDDMQFEADIKIRPEETPAERSHRLRMEARKYWFGEGLMNVSAIAIALSGTGAALVLMFLPGSSIEDKKWAFGILSHLLIAVAGFSFGKAAK